MKTIFSKIFILFLVFLTVETAAQNEPLYKNNPIYWRETALYDIYKTNSADIVMLGNSITHGVNWNELLGREKVVERGIVSDQVEGFYNRMDYVYKLKPKIVFIMGGINDIYNWYPLDSIFYYYEKIIKELKEKNIIPVIQSTLYVSSRWPNSENRNPEVTKFNKILSEYAAKYKIDFIDLNIKLSENEKLKDEMTWDGAHLTAKAYKLWGEEIEKILKKYKL